MCQLFKFIQTTHGNIIMYLLALTIYYLILMATLYWICKETISIVNTGSDGNYLDNSDQITTFQRYHLVSGKL